MIQVWWDLAEVEALLTSVLRKAENPEDIWDDVGQKLLDLVDKGFEKERSPWGQKWAPLRPVTEEYRFCNNGGILEDCGTLRDSFEFEVFGDQIAVWTSLAKSGTLQWGAKKGAYGHDKKGRPIPWGTIPPRPMLPLKGNPGVLDLPSSWVEAVEKVLEDHLQKTIDAAEHKSLVGRTIGHIKDFFRGWF